MVLVLAKIMSKHQMRHGVDNVGIMLSLGVLGLFAGLLIKHGFTNTVLLGGVGFAMLVIGGTQWNKLFIIAGAVALLGLGCLWVKSQEEKPMRELQRRLWS